MSGTAHDAIAVQHVTYYTCVLVDAFCVWQMHGSLGPSFCLMQLLLTRRKRSRPVSWPLRTCMVLFHCRAARDRQGGHVFVWRGAVGAGDKGAGAPGHAQVREPPSLASGCLYWICRCAGHHGRRHWALPCLRLCQSMLQASCCVAAGSSGQMMLKQSHKRWRSTEWLPMRDV